MTLRNKYSSVYESKIPISETGFLCGYSQAFCSDGARSGLSKRVRSKPPGSEHRKEAL